MASATREPSWGLDPYDTNRQTGYLPGLPHPAQAAQRFLTSRSDVLPACPFRPYFMPERPWDSPFRALFLGNGAAPVSRSDALTPLRKPLPSFSSEEEKEIRGVVRPQSLVHRPSPYPPDCPKAALRAEALMGSNLPRVFSPCNQRNRSPELPRASVVVLPPTGARESTMILRLGALPEEG
jgi:hypothetical protein